MGPAHHRRPYVGEGADGARRSAAIDRSEADGLHVLDPRRAQLHDSARAWDRQAEDLDGHHRPITLVAVVDGTEVLVTLWDEDGTIRAATPAGIEGEVAFRDPTSQRWGIPGRLDEAP